MAYFRDKKIQEEKDRLVEEKLRLEYVALTRAEEAVVFMRCKSVDTSFNNYNDLNDVVQPLGFMSVNTVEDEENKVAEINDYRTNEDLFNYYIKSSI